MANPTYQLQLEAAISAENFPTLHTHLKADAAFKEMLMENLERVVQEYLSAAELEIARRENEGNGLQA